MQFDQIGSNEFIQILEICEDWWHKPVCKIENNKKITVKGII